MVKPKFALIGTILAFTTLLTAVPMAAAIIYCPSLVIKSDGQIWEFTPVDLFGNEMFASKDVDVSTVKAYYWAYDDAGNLVMYSLNVKDVHLAGNKVSVTFNKDFLPASAEETLVVGALKNGVDTFEASGPGFVWRKWG